MLPIRTDIVKKPPTVRRRRFFVLFDTIFPIRKGFQNLFIRFGIEISGKTRNGFDRYDTVKVHFLQDLCDGLHIDRADVKELMKITKDGVAYIVLDRKAQFGYKMQEGDTEGFVNEPLSIGKVRMSIFAREDAGEVRISIRSKRGTSANKCAKMFFNGGGHENAAGGKLYMPIEEVGDYIAKHTHIYMTEYED